MTGSPGAPDWFDDDPAQAQVYDAFLREMQGVGASGRRGEVVAGQRVGRRTEGGAPDYAFRRCVMRRRTATAQITTTAPTNEPRRIDASSPPKMK